MSGAPARPVVLLHGCGGTAGETFIDTGWVNALRASGREGWVLDLPGHGRAGASHDPQEYADLAGSLIDALPPGGFDIVGFSLGAKLALELLLRLPGRIGRAVLGGLGDNAFAPERVAAAAATALESGPTADTPAPVMTFLREWNPASNDALAIAAVLRRPANPVFSAERLRPIAVPVLLIHGADDRVARQCDELRGALPGARVSTIAAAGHFDLPRHPAFLRQSLEFLAAAT